MDRTTKSLKIAVSSEMAFQKFVNELNSVVIGKLYCFFGGAYNNKPLNFQSLKIKTRSLLYGPSFRL